MILVEIAEASSWQAQYEKKNNDDCLYINLDLLCKKREKAQTREVATKRMTTRKYNSKVKSRTF